MDTTRFGFLNFMPYSNTKCMLALFTKELGKRKGIKAYALCTGIVQTEMIDRAPLLVRLVSRALTYFSTLPDEVI